jgi:hypothetical protein
VKDDVVDTGNLERRFQNSPPVNAQIKSEIRIRQKLKNSQRITKPTIQNGRA